MDELTKLGSGISQTGQVVRLVNDDHIPVELTDDVLA